MSAKTDWPEYFHPGPPLAIDTRTRSDGDGSFRLEIAMHDGTTCSVKMTMEAAIDLYTKLGSSLYQARTEDMTRGQMLFDTSLYLEYFNLGSARRLA